jgi:4-hydroxy-tetrahydrodipicolinate synthase
MPDLQRLKGVLAPVVTPFRADLTPDPERFVAHCRWLLSQHTGLAVFGTNSEANSQSTGERMALLEALVTAGLDPGRMMPGTGCCALTDTVQLTAHAVRLGCAGVLMLPPFYYKGVSDEGLYRHFSDVIQRVGDTRLRIYLYHIPPVAVVGISLPLIERLLKDYPGTIAGIKDSSGDWNNTRAMLESFATSGFDVFVGSETFLLANMRHSGAGCISATANVNPAAIHQLYATWQKPSADAQQAQLDVVRDAFGKKYTMIAALKQAIAHFGADPVWATVRPPLQPLTAAETTTFITELHEIGFTMPGLPHARTRAVA